MSTIIFGVMKGIFSVTKGIFGFTRDFLGVTRGKVDVSLGELMQREEPGSGRSSTSQHQRRPMLLALALGLMTTCSSLAIAGVPSEHTPAPVSGLPAAYEQTAASGQPSQRPATQIVGEAVSCEGLDLMQVVRLLLANDPQIGLVETRVASAQGVLRQAQAGFEPALSSELTRSRSVDPSLTGTARETEALSSTLTVSRKLRTGQSLEPSLSLNRSEIDGGGAVNSGTLQLTLRQPLLRERRAQVVTGDERAARLALDAERLELRHTLASRLLAAVTQYWQLRAAALDLEILQTSERRSRELLATTRRLISADLTPAAEAIQLEADLAAKEASRLGGESSLYAARRELGRQLGLTPDGIDALPLACEPMPELPATDAPAGDLSRELLDLALAHRADLRAARVRLARAKVSAMVARDGLQPRLDLLVAPSYRGIMSGGQAADVLGGLYRNAGGLGAKVGLDLSWPLSRGEAEGQVIVAEATLRQRMLEVETLERELGAEVPTAVDKVLRGALQLSRAAAAVRLFGQAVDNEEKKLRAGSSTLLDVISQQDRLTGARQRQVSARLSLAVALAELRYRTGTLLEESGDEEVRVSPSEMTRLPEPAAGRTPLPAAEPGQ